MKENNKTQFQVSFYFCKAHIPFHFAVHPWVVIYENGTTTRYEIIHKIYQGKDHDGYIYKNFYQDPTQGIKKSPLHHSFWKSELIGTVSGGNGSLAHRIARFIKTNNPSYEYKNKYRLVGPNSNTYISWILGNFPELGIKLPWNAFGKGHK
jgi:hypothetical protein